MRHPSRLLAIVVVCAGMGGGIELCVAETVNPQLGKRTVSRWQMGVVISAAHGACSDLKGYMAIPTDWPEQQVAIVKEDITPGTKIGCEMVDDGAMLMKMRFADLGAGQAAKMRVTFEIRRSAILPPTNKGIFVVPDAGKLPPEILRYLKPSPLIQSNAPEICGMARELAVGENSAWSKAETIYDWVDQHIQFEDGPWKGALAALNDGTGDCEDRSALFIAMCRSVGIPARTVWVPDHCYSEFYLEDDEGRGRWFPCQSTGPREFGHITELLPILQKGDDFRPPPNGGPRQRYMAEFLTGVPATDGTMPKISFLRDELKDRPGS
jgi:hypothetical protein